MQWIGKALGGVLGFAVGGPWGSMLGAALGHQFDQGLGAHALREGLFSASTAQALFFKTTFEMMGHLAKSDGRVTENEIRVARQIMHGMGLAPDAVRDAIGHFTAGKSRSYPLERRVQSLRAAARGHNDIARAFMDIQMQAAMGAGGISQTQRRLLWTAAQALGLGRVEFAQIEATVRGRSQGSVAQQSLPLDAAYRTLGIEARASDQQVKTAYRRLMSQHHPDKLVSRGLPESMTEVAKQKTHEIRAAYERIKSERSLK